MLMRLFASLALIAGACAAPAQQAPAPATATQHGGAVSAADPRAVEAGVETLRAGGSAVDAAIATMLALTVVEPQSSGIGGGGFLVYHDQQRHDLTSYDGRETAPHAATPSYFLDAQGQPRQRSDAIPGGMSVGWPAAAAALRYARHVRLPAPAAAASVWQCLSAPASPPRLAPLPGPALVMKKLI